MKNFIELKYHKNSKQEIIFENLDEIKENDNVVLKLKDGNLTSIMYFIYKYNHSHLKNPIIIGSYVNKENYHILYDTIVIEHLSDDNHETWMNEVYFFDCEFHHSFVENIYNILPKWNIPEDSAVLFLNAENVSLYDVDKFIKKYDLFNYKLYGISSNLQDIYWSGYKQDDYSILNSFRKNTNKISLIIPELHVEDKNCHYHIGNINKLCKELKEEYEVSKIQLFVSHFFIKDIAIHNHYFTYYNNSCISYNIEDWEEVFCINKITTTNSTGFLEVQKNDRLEVVDCLEFFDI